MVYADMFPFYMHGLIALQQLDRTHIQSPCVPISEDWINCNTGGFQNCRSCTFSVQWFHPKQTKYSWMDVMWGSFIEKQTVTTTPMYLCSADQADVHISSAKITACVSSVRYQKVLQLHKHSTSILLTTAYPNRFHRARIGHGSMKYGIVSTH